MRVVAVGLVHAHALVAHDLISPAADELASTVVGYVSPSAQSP